MGRLGYPLVKSRVTSRRGDGGRGKERWREVFEEMNTCTHCGSANSFDEALAATRRAGAVFTTPSYVAHRLVHVRNPGKRRMRPGET